jgi:hypothetical protein
MSDEAAKRDLPPGASPRSGLPPPAHTRWKPGQSGNPGGRPKGESIVALLRRVLEQEHHGRPLKEILAERLVKEALAGKHAFVKELLDRVEGPVNQRHEVKQSNDVRIIVADARGNERVGSFDDIRDYAMGINVPEGVRGGAPPTGSTLLVEGERADGATR